MNRRYKREDIKELENIKLKYNALLETIPYITWFMDNDGIYRDVNKEFSKHSGKEISDVRGKDHKYVWERKKGNECEENDLKVLQDRKPMMFEEIVRGIEGYRWFDVYRSPVINEKNEAIGIVAVARDITEIKNREAQFKILIENIPFDIWQYDIEGNIVIANTRFAKRFNMKSDEIIGIHMSKMYSEKSVKKVKEENSNIVKSKKPMRVVKRINECGKDMIFELYKTPIFNIVGEVVGIAAISIDITEVVRAKEKIKKQAYTDYNTGLLNRRALYEHINYKAKFKPKTVIILDVDKFKEINDTYGHHVGDEVLVQIAEKLKEISNEADVFRFGGDEFLVVYDKKLDKREMEFKAEEILRELSKIEVEKEKIAVSIGVAGCECAKNCSCKRNEEDCRVIIKADVALYNAKKYKKNGYVIYTEELEREMMYLNKLEKSLNHILERNELELAYQPQYTSDGKIIGFEALFRWNNEEYKGISVQKIIEIMEKNKSIIQVGTEIMKKACIFAKRINEGRTEKVVVSFNVSAVQITDSRFIKKVKEVLSETNVSTECIGIEITESVVIEDIEKNMKKLNELKEMGIKISLDDFGTGYSSFNYLVKLPLSVVKIDKSFSMEMDNYKEYKTLLKLIVDASNSLNLDIIAEGVETKEQLKVLKEIGVKYIQGYLFSKPVEEKNAIDLLKSENIN
ncbi:MAG: sensor domain-containing protein [Clostridium sp.]|uniref:sensor domain-containing protein n=1 Tax=Clostridium sp. TaxID=1506 RepID=UPI003EE5D95E